MSEHTCSSVDCSAPRATRRIAASPPAGSLYRRNRRWWWAVRLPGGQGRQAIPLRAAPGRPATRERAVALKIAGQLWAEALAAQADREPPNDPTVGEVAEAYLNHATVYYRRPDGTTTSELGNCRLALGPLVEAFGDLPADDLGAKHPGYMGVLHAAKAGEEAYVVFKVDAPRDITRVRYGGRFYNRAPRSHIDLLHSFDGGKTWTRTYSLTDTKPPWDVIHYETADKVPAGTRSVLLKYLLNSSAAGTNACSIYAVRMEVNHRPADATPRPIEVTFNWSERRKDYSLVERSDTQVVRNVPFRYTINVGGDDLPVVNWLRVSLKGAALRRAQGKAADVEAGYSDGRDVGGEKFVHRWVTYGRNLAEGKPYTVSVPSGSNWGAGDPQGRKLTDGVVGPPYAGGVTPRYGLAWQKGQKPDVTVDLGKAAACGAFRIQIGAGWPWWDAIKGEVEDTVEVLTSLDGKAYTQCGSFDFDLHWRDIPINHFMPDDETAKGYTFALIPPKPVQARYVRFRITPQRTLTVSEVQVLDSIRFQPFDLRIALPDEKVLPAPAEGPEGRAGAEDRRSPQ